MAQTKQQKEMIVLAALVVVAALVWFMYFGKRGTAAAAFSSHGPYTPIDAVSYKGVFIGLSEAQNTAYKPSGRNIFIVGPAPAPVADSNAVVKAVKPAYLPQGPLVPPPPPLPVLSMKFFGMGSLPSSGPRRAFLLDGEEVRIVGEGDTLPNNIRITRIGNDRIEFEDTMTGQKNSKPIELPPPPA